MLMQEFKLFRHCHCNLTQRSLEVHARCSTALGEKRGETLTLVLDEM